MHICLCVPPMSLCFDALHCIPCITVPLCELVFGFARSTLSHFGLQLCLASRHSDSVQLVVCTTLHSQRCKGIDHSIRFVGKRGAASATSVTIFHTKASLRVLVRHHCTMLTASFVLRIRCTDLTCSTRPHVVNMLKEIRSFIACRLLSSFCWGHDVARPAMPGCRAEHCLHQQLVGMSFQLWARPHCIS